MARTVLPTVLALLAVVHLGCFFSGGDADGDPCNPDPCTDVAGRECRAGRCVAGDLAVLDRDAAGLLRGSWRPLGEGDALSFEVSRDGLGGASASFSWPDGTTVSASVSGEMGWVLVGDVSVDGYGAPSQEERDALDVLRALPGDGLALLPLDLACAETDIEPAELAALLLPWQMLLKFTDERGTVIGDRAAASACSYFPDVEEPGSAPRPDLLRLSYDNPIPNVFGFFPFDAEGAVDSTPVLFLSLDAAADASTTLLSGPCGALCRGTCGPDCTKNNCEEIVEWRCETDAAGLQTGVKNLWTVYTCGTALGCRKHDECYDACNEGRCDTWSAAVCRRGCDVEATLEFGPSNGQSWARGYGPYDSYLSYEYPWDAPMTDEALCAVETEDEPPDGPDPPDVPGLDPEIYAACLSACGNYNALCEGPADCEYDCTSEQTSWTLDKPCALAADACRAGASTCRDLLACPSAVLNCSDG